jgi:predicted nuclease of predicted toxin-antitoxin system
MKLLLDQGLPRSAADLLRNMGIDAVHVAEVGQAAAEDEAILQMARSEDRVVVTLDADFHTLLVLSQSASPSVIRIRIERLKAADLADLLKGVLAQCEKELIHGAMVTVQEGRIRIHLLPVSGP